MDIIDNRKKEYLKIIKYFETRKNYNRIHLDFLPESIQEKIFDLTSFLDEYENITNSERIFCIKNYIYEKPKCLYCGKPVEFNLKKMRYKVYCNVKCAGADPKKQEKTENTNLERYGVRFLSHNEEIAEKIKQVNLKKFGVENPMQNKDIAKKSHDNNKRTDKEIIEHMRKVTKEKYNVEFPMQNKEIQEKAKATNLERYGVENPMQNKEIAKNLGYKIAQNTVEKIFSNPKLLEYVTPLFSKEKYSGYKDHNLYLYRCNICGKEFKDWIDGTYKRIPRCPNCFPIKKSAIEYELFYYISNDLNIKCIQNDRYLLKDKELDIYIPEKNIAFELDGLYWHRYERIGKQNCHFM